MLSWQALSAFKVYNLDAEKVHVEGNKFGDRFWRITHFETALSLFKRLIIHSAIFDHSAKSPSSGQINC